MAMRMTTSTRDGGRNEDGDYDYAYRVHYLRLHLFEVEEKEEITTAGGIERCRPNHWRKKWKRKKERLAIMRC